MTDIFEQIEKIILCNSIEEKCSKTHELNDQFDQYVFNHQQLAAKINLPGYPDKLTLVSPRELKRRGMQKQIGRNVLMHAVAHIEYNAIHLALDAALRFKNQPIEYYRDWIGIAADEARHFAMVTNYLKKNECEYGDFPAHNGLWDMAVRTQNDIVARMALVPRVLEARGLDVTPGMIERFKAVQDTDAIKVLNVILEDEIEHVKTGSHWLFYQCQLRDLEPKATFTKMVEKHMHGELRGPFNISARLQAGFDETELKALIQRYDR